MTKIYSKDECAPDALSAIDWLNERLQQSGDAPINFLKQSNIEVNHEFNQDRTLYFAANLQYYKIEYSCGVYEDLHKIALEELITELTQAAKNELSNPDY